MKIIVIEMYERDVVGITECDSIEEAINMANELLEWHMEAIDYTQEFEDREYEDYEWGFATKDCLNAWCNLGNDNWDAHIVEF